MTASAAGAKPGGDPLIFVRGCEARKILPTPFFLEMLRTISFSIWTTLPQMINGRPLSVDSLYMNRPNTPCEPLFVDWTHVV